ncbi:diguanylate cyclase domain-containing protein [Roseateles sp. DB2]|uniref:diguanylate cyclase domain-containing protein n=1 Tax=Roseateles sp. DB2 TaxID=3453717 RepID=UPI003EE864E4
MSARGLRSFGSVVLRPGRLQGGQRQPGACRGRQALQTVATRLRQRMRAHDRVVRVGGDGFVLRLPALAAARKWTVCRARPIRPCSVRRPVVEGSS